MSATEEPDQAADEHSAAHSPTGPADGPDATDAAMPSADSTLAIGKGSLIGHRLGDFQVLRKLGSGGMADVYIARQTSLARDVALKVLKSEFARDEDYVARFRREARAAAKLNHPNIVQVYDVGSADSKHYIAQELIDGVNLRKELARTGWLDARRSDRCSGRCRVRAGGRVRGGNHAP